MQCLGATISDSYHQAWRSDPNAEQYASAEGCDVEDEEAEAALRCLRHRRCHRIGIRPGAHPGPADLDRPCQGLPGRLRHQRSQPTRRHRPADRHHHVQHRHCETRPISHQHGRQEPHDPDRLSPCGGRPVDHPDRHRAEAHLERQAHQMGTNYSPSAARSTTPRTPTSNAPSAPTTLSATSPRPGCPRPLQDRRRAQRQVRLLHHP